MSFGPAFILDKSTLQGLSFEDIVILTRYFRHPIPPILLRELTSDLAKESRGNGDQEMKKKVAFLAAQVSLSHWAVLPDAYKMACNELLSADIKIPMNGAQAPCDRAVAVTTPQMGRGFFLSEHPMLETLRNLSSGNFILLVIIPDRGSVRHISATQMDFRIFFERNDYHNPLRKKNLGERI